MAQQCEEEGSVIRRETKDRTAGRSEDPVREVLLETGLWQVNTISPAASVLDALAVMEEKDVGALVVTEDEDPVGVISERDCARRVLLEGKDPARASVASVMSDVVCFATANKEVSECIELMLRRHIRHLPIMFGCCLVGCVSLRNLIEYVYHGGSGESRGEGGRPSGEEQEEGSSSLAGFP